MGFNPTPNIVKLNLLRQSTLNLNILAWKYSQGPFDYKATPLVPLGFPVMIHRKTPNSKSWEFRGKDGCSIGVALDHYFQRVIPQDTKAKIISDLVEFRHKTITALVVTPKYRILRGIATLTDTLTDAPTAQSDA